MPGAPPLLGWIPPLALALVLTLPARPSASQEVAGEPERPLDEARTVREEANAEGVASQKRIDSISDETETLFSRYSTALRQIDSIRVYNSQMSELIASQEAELSSLQHQLDRVEVVGRSVTPLMRRMIDALDAFVRLDVPFLLDERSQRMADLRARMPRADVTNAEKFRRIMEAYQIENEYGRTIEAYRSTLDRDGREVTVDFLRFGRIALVYQSLDEGERGVWDQETRSWKPLDRSYRSAIRQGLRIARKQAAPDLIRLPLPAAEEEAG
jgi:hypothetical protein